MSRRQQEEFLAAATDLANRFASGDDDLTVPEIKDLLRDSGSDTEALLGRFHGAVKELESKLWERGKTPPRYLRRLVKKTAGAGALPEDPSAARSRIQEWLDRFREGLSSLESSQLEVLHAYRKRGDLTAHDVELLERLEQKLKRKLSGGQGGE
jgi:hypothetical protein